MTVKIDEKIVELFDVLTKQRKEIETIEAEIKTPWRTNCSLQGLSLQGIALQSINVQTANKERILEITAALLQLQDYRAKASKILDMEASEILFGFHLNDWLSDLKKRISIINIKEKKAKFDALETRLNAIVSPEQRRLMELEAIQKSLEI